LAKLENDIQVEQTLVNDFYALGFCHFQVELLTRQLRYMSNLDEVGFEREILAASEAAVQENLDAARDRLRAAFDLLTEAREYFYPVETYLLDLTLLAATTAGSSLRRELADASTNNFLVSGEVLEYMAREEPETLAHLKKALEENKASVIGGEMQERELPLLPAEAILESLQEGLCIYQQHLGHRPKIFGRRRFGLTPVLPQILKKLGFDGVLHFTLDAGRFPTGNQSKLRWEGIDSTSIESLVRIPLDAAKPESFLKLPERLGDTMDLDHAATCVFAHWPSHASQWYRDLRSMAEYSPVLGRFTTATSYFQDTEYVGQSSKYRADQYRSPYLRQAVARHEPDPISRWYRYFRNRATLDAIKALSFLTDTAGAMEPGTTSELPADSTLYRETSASELCRQLDHQAQRFSRGLVRPNAGRPRGFLLINPWSFLRRVCLDVSDLERLPRDDAVKLAAESERRKKAVVEVPGMGFVWVGAGQAREQAARPEQATKRRKKKEQPPLAEGHTLRNDFCQVTIDPVTGAIKSVHDYATRGSRLGQQIAFRFPSEGRAKQNVWGEEDVEQDYTVMAADEVVVTVSDKIEGKIATRGRLLDREGGLVARFAQTVRVQRGSPVVELEIDLDIDRQPGPDPWASYYAARFAWGDATADVYRSANQLSVPTDVTQLESPYFVEIRGQKTRTTIMANGLPYHRRIGLRKLDTLLVVRGETARSFRLGVGLDLKHPVPAALDFLAPQNVVEGAIRPPHTTGWLFHVGARNVVATHWAPKYDDGRLSGFCVRLMETEGHRVDTHLRACRPVGAAAKFHFDGQQTVSLTVQDDRISIPLEAYEWTQVEAGFL
jgi:alpha-mannosidase